MEWDHCRAGFKLVIQWSGGVFGLCITTRLPYKRPWKSVWFTAGQQITYQVSIQLNQLIFKTNCVSMKHKHTKKQSSNVRNRDLLKHQFLTYPVSLLSEHRKDRKTGTQTDSQQYTGQKDRTTAVAGWRRENCHLPPPLLLHKLEYPSYVF